MNNTYRIAIIYFCLFALMLLGSSIALFSTKMAFALESINSYYAGDEAHFIAPKSLEGLLETITPHTFAMALFVMVLTHFVLFIKKQKNATTITLVILLYIALFIEIFSPLMIRQGYTLFTLLKLVSYSVVELLSLYFIGIVYF